MRILLLGSGGREHAIAWKIAQSPLPEKLYIAPGNAGTRSCGENVNINPSDFTAIRAFCLEQKINMVVVGPEGPLVKGIHDFFLNDKDLAGIPVIGPVVRAAMLEGSKDFAKKFMSKFGIPTARYHSFTNEAFEDAVSCLDTFNPPYVIKADGLAAGKGVLITSDKQEASDVLKDMLYGKKFGEAGEKVVIEEFLQGIEVSVFIVTDGNSYKILPPVKDYKRIGEGDTGPNTGGMGSVCPVPFADEAFMKKVEERIIIPTVEGLKKEGISYKGFIFFGLMNCKGDPYVIEYNVRLGDPEAESLLPKIQSDIVELFNAVAENRLSGYNLEIAPGYITSVMMVSKGYPGSYEKGKPVSGLDKVNGSMVFHAGTAFDETKGEIVTNGGRVMTITSTAPTIDGALAKSYQNVSRVDFSGKNFRRDIGKDLINL